MSLPSAILQVHGLVREVLEPILYQRGIQEYESSLVSSLAIHITRHVMKQFTTTPTPMEGERAGKRKGHFEGQSETRPNTRNDVMLKLAKTINRKPLPKKFKRRSKRRRAKNLNARRKRSPLIC